MRPSIIFFDEIDGLAPVRSSRQDQIHRLAALFIMNSYTSATRKPGRCFDCTVALCVFYYVAIKFISWLIVQILPPISVCFRELKIL